MARNHGRCSASPLPGCSEGVNAMLIVGLCTALTAVVAYTVWFLVSQWRRRSHARKLEARLRSRERANMEGVGAE